MRKVIEFRGNKLEIEFSDNMFIATTTDANGAVIRTAHDRDPLRLDEVVLDPACTIDSPNFLSIAAAWSVWATLDFLVSKGVVTMRGPVSAPNATIKLIRVGESGVRVMIDVDNTGEYEEGALLNEPGPDMIEMCGDHCVDTSQYAKQ